MSGKKRAPKRCDRAMSTSEKKLELDLCMYQSISNRVERECIIIGAKSTGDPDWASFGSFQERRLRRNVKSRKCQISGRDLRLAKRNKKTKGVARPA